MSDLASFPLLQAAGDFGLLTSDEIEVLLVQYRQWAQRGRKIPLEEFLKAQKKLNSRQIRGLKNFISRGYAFCSLCPKAYSISSQKKLPPCPQCGNSLSRRHFSPSQREDEIFQFSTQSQPPPSRFQSQVPPSLEVTKTLGQGGYGQVYEVKEPLSGRKMALKVIHSRNSQSFRQRQRFEREIRITAHLEHPHIIPLYESGYLEDGSLYYSMKEFRGGTLKDLLEEASKKGQRELRPLLDIFIKVCDGLAYAHHRGVIHRDLKPDNIAVDDYGEVMVMDWGIARWKDSPLEAEEPSVNLSDLPTPDEDGDLTQTGSMMGTVGYMAPEQLRGKVADERSDVFSLGVILYQILCLRRPFRGNVQARMMATLQKEPTPPEAWSHSFDIPAELSAITLKALAKDSQERYQTVEELKKDLFRFRQGYSVSAKKDSLFESLVKWTLRHRALSLSLVGCLLVVILSLSILFWWQGYQEDQKIGQYYQRAEEILKEKKIWSYRELQPLYQEDQGKISPQVQRRREESLAQLVRAKEVLEKAFSLKKDRETAEKIFALEKKIGLLALLGKDYLLSRMAFERGDHLGFSDRADQLMEKWKEVRRRHLEKALDQVESIMFQLARQAPPEGMREEYVNRLVRLRGQEVTKRLLSYVNHSQIWCRLVAIEALGKRGDLHRTYKGKEVGQWLRERLEEVGIGDNSLEAIALVWALGRLRDPKAEPLVSRLRYKSGRFSSFWNQTALPYSWLPLEKGGKGKGQNWGKKGHILYEQGRYKEAIEAFEKALRKNPEKTDCWNTLGLAQNALKKPRKAIESYTRAIELDPNHYIAYSNRGAAYHRLGKFKEALKDYRRALKKEENKAILFANMGGAYMGLGKFHRAIEFFTKAIKINPDYASGYHNRGMAYYELNQNRRALKDLNRAIKLNPRSTVTWDSRGLVHRELGSYDQALSDFTKAIDLNPRFVSAWDNRGRTYKMMGKKDRALSDFTQAIKLGTSESLTYNSRGRIFVEKRKFDKAIDDLNRAIELNPDYSSHYSYRGKAYYEKGQYEKALADFNKSLQLKPNQENIFFNRGFTWLRLKKYRQGLRDLKKFIERAPRDPRVPMVKKVIDQLESRLR